MQQFGHLIYKEGQDNHPREYEILEVEGKTDYNYAEFLELDQRLLSYTKQIENFKTFTWEDKHNYQTIRLENIKSHFLDQNDEYQAMRNMITMFNNEMRDSERRNVKVRNGVWRFQFFTQLKQVIYDIEFFKKEREIQRLYVSKVYKWATEMLQKFDYQSRRLDSDNNPPKIPLKRPFSNQKRPQSALTIKTVRPYSGYPTTIDGQAETTIDQSLPDRPESAITGNIKFNDMKDSMFSKQPLPSDQIQEQLQDYKSKARTKHDNYEPPGTKLKQYKRRIIHNIPNRPVTSVQPVNKNQTFKKPPRSAVIPQIEEQEQEQIQDEEEVQEQENQEQIEQAIQLVLDQDKKTKEGFLDPLIKVFKNDDQLEDNFKRKLDFEKRDNYIVYETSKDQNEIKLQNYYQQKRQKEAAQKREDEEMITQMRHWSQNKARVDKEISRRIESAKVGNRFREMELKQQTDEEKDLKEMNKLYERHKASFIKSQQERDLELSDLSDEGIDVDYETGQIDEGGERIRQRPQSSKPLQNHLVNIHPQLPKPQIQMKFYNNTDFRGLEEQIKNHNINKIKQLHGGLLQLAPQEDESSKLPPEQSMSVYGKNQNFAKKPRPFSAVIASYPIEQAQRDQIQEIEDIRIRLAQKDVYIPMNKLVKAMLVPEPHNDQDKEGKNLPPPGFGMLVDPFEKKKKKKAPRKKRSKK